MRWKPLHSLTKSQDFKAVFNEGVSSSSSFLVIYAKPNELRFSRLGLAVSRKIGNAVIRNRIRRLLREAMRECVKDMAEHYDFVIIARKASVEGTLKTFMSSIEKFLQRVYHAKNSNIVHSRL